MRQSSCIVYSLFMCELRFPAVAVAISHRFPRAVSRYATLDPALCSAHSQLHRSVYKAGQRREEDGWGVAARGL